MEGDVSIQMACLCVACSEDQTCDRLRVYFWCDSRLVRMYSCISVQTFSWFGPGFSCCVHAILRRQAYCSEKHLKIHLNRWETFKDKVSVPFLFMQVFFVRTNIRTNPKMI